MKRNGLTPLTFNILAAIVGMVTGLGSYAFRALIALFHNLFFLGVFSFEYNANQHTPPSPWGWLVIGVPVAGAVGVTFLVTRYAPEAKGHGVPEVMDAIYYDKGIIRPAVALVKSLASALSIGTGGSVGREGPIVQIGSSLGSTVGQVVPMAIWQRITLIAAGAGSGIAATFNTPVGGLLFAIEIMLHEVSARTLVPVAISTAMATYVGRIFFGVHPSFVIPTLSATYFHLTSPWVLTFYVGLGILTGLVSTLYIRSIYAFEDFFDQRIKGNYYVRHLGGMFVVGVIMYVFLRTTGQYHVEGVGYATVQDILTGGLTSLGMLAVLFLAKLLVTSLTLGSGASGGIFSPGLFLGATLGAAYGHVLGAAFPGLTIAPAAFAVAGMAGVIGGSTGAAVAAIVMIFEMTLDYNVIIPMTITVAISYGVRVALCKPSIYTLKLVRRGHYMPESLRANYYHVWRAKDFMNHEIRVMDAAEPVQTFFELPPEEQYNQCLIVSDEDRIAGILDPWLALSPTSNGRRKEPLGEFVHQRYAVATPQSTLSDVVELMYGRQASTVLILENTTEPKASQVRGFVQKGQIADLLGRGFEIMAH